MPTVKISVENALNGPYPILSVPYHEDGSVDHETLVEEAEFVALRGVKGFIWAQSGDAIDLLTVEERKASFEPLVRTFAGRDVVVVLGCQGVNTSDMETLAQHVETLAEKYPTTPLAISCRPPLDAHDQIALERYYRALAQIARRPVIIQTWGSDERPLPSSELLIRLSREYPEIFRWIKEESGGADANERMKVECLAPEFKTVFSAWGSYGWLFQHRVYGTRGVITERVAYADVLVRMWAALERGDHVEADEIFSRYLLMMNLKETMPGSDLRGFNLYAMRKRGVFKNYVSRDYVDAKKTPGKWKLVEEKFTAAEIREIEDRFSRLVPYMK